MDATLMQVRSREVVLPGQNGGEVPALIVEPAREGVFPAVVFGAEAMGPNRFGRRTAEAVAALGYVTITPDYYRGRGPSEPDNYDDFTEVIAAIDALDFRQATFDLLAAVDWARAQPGVDAERIVLWGYCTGATLAMLGAALDRRIAATLLFFPSQPSFHEITDKRPVHAWDLIWAIRSPVLVVSGGDDPILPPAVIDELRRRFEQNGVEHEIHVYAGAGHAFTGEARHMHHAEATAASWAAAKAFLARHCP
jgi:carboxymethylenebutenolidase